MFVLITALETSVPCSVGLDQLVRTWGEGERRPRGREAMRSEEPSRVAVYQRGKKQEINFASEIFACSQSYSTGNML